ncbi:MAG TPA: plastocyanin/azurin family copper-binding protein [Gemmatimonadales bacterium]|nr:plastocyanin/azurin family copper-binding protein [Gemmatimonadales bacterium]
MTRRATLLAVLLLGAAGCGPSPARHDVEIRELAFGPAVLQVSAGDTIVWNNHDMFPHTATADGAAGWDTGLIPADSSQTAVARRPGTFTYVCRVHPTMRGQVIVH